jgi:membrane protease YdiL (CAAX protease family)
MEAGSINLKTLARTVAAVAAVEVGVSLLIAEGRFHPMMLLGAARLLEILLIILMVRLWAGGLESLGLSALGAPYALERGLLWSAGLGLIAACAWVILLWAGLQPLRLIRAQLPPEGNDLVLLFLVGGLLGPVAEELFFRGVLYGFLRRWGVPAAVLLSSLIFVLSHPTSHGVRLTQAVGGVLFAVAYEVERSLLVPITIHVLGNLVIFSLSLLS